MGIKDQMLSKTPPKGQSSHVREGQTTYMTEESSKRATAMSARKQEQEQPNCYGGGEN